MREGKGKDFCVDVDRRQESSSSSGFKLAVDFPDVSQNEYMCVLYYIRNEIISKKQTSCGSDGPSIHPSVQRSHSNTFILGAGFFVRLFVL